MTKGIEGKLRAEEPEETDDKLGVEEDFEITQATAKSRLSKTQPAFELAADLKEPVSITEARKPETSKKKFELTRGMIKGAGSIDEICEIIRRAEKISGEKEEGEYTSDYVENRIREFEKFLEDNMDALLTSVITGKKDNKNDILLKKLIYIPKGLGIRQKVKDLMEIRWNNIFQENKKELMANSVAQTTTLEELYKVISQFRVIHYGDKEYLPQEVIKRIKEADKNLNLVVETGGFTEVEVKKINTEIRSVLSEQEIPNEAGIFNQAYKLIYENISKAIKERNLKNYSDQINQGGFFSRLGRRAARFFGRK